MRSRPSTSSGRASGGSRTFIGAVGAAGGALAAAAGTTVEMNGALLVNNGTQSGTLDVNFGSLAKGAGTFGAVNVADGGRFSPGNSPGTATVGALTFGAGGRYDFELSRANATPGATADFIHDTGPLSIASGVTPNSAFTIAPATLDDSGQSAPLPDFDPSRPYTLTLATADGGVSGFDPTRFSIDASAFRNALNGGQFSVSQAGNSLLLQFTPVPEPASAALLCGGGLLALSRRGRRQRLTRTCWTTW